MAIYNPESAEGFSSPVEGRDEPSLRQRIVRGSFWAITGSICQQGMIFLALIMCARMLGTEAFGELGIVRNTVGMLGVFGGIGLGLTATRHVAQFRHCDIERTSRVIRLCLVTASTLGVAVAGITAALAPVIAERMLSSDKLAVPLMIGSALLFLYSFDGVQKGILAGFEAYSTIARASAGVGIVIIPVVALLTRFAGLNGALVGLAIAAAFGLVLNKAGLRRVMATHGVPGRGKGFWREKRILFGFSLPAFLASALVFPATWSANVLLVNQPNGLVQMGYLSAADQMRQILLFLPVSGLQCLLPILAERSAGDSDRLVTRLHVLNLYAGAFLVASIVALMLPFADAVMRLYGGSFSAGRTTMILMLCCTPIAAYREGINRLLQARSLLWLTLASCALWASILLVSATFLVTYGSSGIALAHLLAYTLNSLVVVPLVLHKLRLRLTFRRDVVLPVLLILPMLLTAYAGIGELSFPVKLRYELTAVLMIGVSGLWLTKCFREASMTEGV